MGTKKNAEAAPETEVLYQCLLPAEMERGVEELRRIWGCIQSGGYAHCSVVAQFNNTSEHHEVLALFDRAIERQRMIDGMQDAAPMQVEKELTD